MPDAIDNGPKIAAACDAVYATFIEDEDLAQKRATVIQALDIFYASATGKPRGDLISRMEGEAAGSRWRRYDENPES